MSELKVIDFHGKRVIDSREVAERVEKQHKDLLRDIRGYVEIMKNSGERKIAPSDFFIPSTYINSQSKEQPCFLITRKGCDMIANKLTGKKGVLFTAAYVTAFEDMRHALTDGPRRTPEVSPGGLAKLIAATRRIMIDMGSSPVEVGAMAKGLLETWGIPVPVAFAKQIPGQLCLSGFPELPLIGGDHS